MTYILTKNHTIYKASAEDSDAYHVLEKDSNNIFLIFKEDVIYTHDNKTNVEMKELSISIEMPEKFMSNHELVEKIVTQAPFKPFYPTHYDIINDTYICEHEDGNTYVYDSNICEYINEKELENDHLYSKDSYFRFSMNSLDEHIKEHKFKLYAESLSKAEKDAIDDQVCNIYLIKVKDFEKPFVAQRVIGNNKSNYFDHDKGYFYVRRGDGTMYKYNYDSVESYIDVDAYFELSNDFEDNENE